MEHRSRDLIFILVVGVIGPADLLATYTFIQVGDLAARDRPDADLFSAPAYRSFWNLATRTGRHRRNRNTQSPAGLRFHQAPDTCVPVAADDYPVCPLEGGGCVDPAVIHGRRVRVGHP